MNYNYFNTFNFVNSKSAGDSSDGGSEDNIVKKPKRSRMEQSSYSGNVQSSDYDKDESFGGETNEVIIKKLKQSRFDEDLNFNNIYELIISSESGTSYVKQFFDDVIPGYPQNELTKSFSELLQFTEKMSDNEISQNLSATFLTNKNLIENDHDVLLHVIFSTEISVVFLLVTVSCCILISDKKEKPSFFDKRKIVISCFVVIIVVSNTVTPVFAVQSTIDSSILATDAVHEKSGHNTVCTTITDCYVFYIKTGPSLAYVKSTDGGFTWNVPVTINSTQNWLGVAIWYDRWTPGDDTGNLIHFAAIESGTDRIWYGHVDTANNDALTTLVQTVPSAVGGLGTTNDVAITKATDGKLYVGTVDATAPTGNLNSIRTCSSSCSNTSSWSSAGLNPWDGSTTDGTPNNKRAVDSLVLLPLTGGDVMIVDHNNISGSSDHVKYAIYSTTTNSTSSDFTDIDTGATYSTTFPHTISGSVDKTTNTVYISYVTDAGTSGTSSVKAWKYTSSWSALSDPYPPTTGTSILDSNIASSSNGNSLYVAYIQDPNPSTSTTDRNSYYVKSTDGGTTWSTGNLLSTVSAGNLEGISIDAVPQSRVFATWANIGTSDLLGNIVYSPQNISVNLSENMALQDSVDEPIVIAENQQLVANSQQQITVDPSRPQLVITSSTADLSNIIIPSTVNDATLDYSKILQTSGTTSTVYIANSLTFTKDINGDSQSDVKVTISGNSNVSGVSWNGTLNLTTVKNSVDLTFPVSSGQVATAGVVIDVGSSTSLTFDQPVRMLFAGQSGKQVGFFHNTDTVTEITTICTSDSTSGMPSGANECKINVGSDLVVWTKHFTGFGTWSSSSPSGGSTGGAGVGGGGGFDNIGTGASSTVSETEFGAGPYLKIQKISYDTCSKQVVRIEIATDYNQTDPSVIVRTSITGIVNAHLVPNQPYRQENINNTIRQLVYEAHLDSKEKSFEVLLMGSIGHNVYSAGKIVDVTDCQQDVDMANTESDANTIVLGVPKIFDVKFQTDNGSKILADDSLHQYIDIRPITISSIVDSPTPIQHAYLRFVKLGQDVSKYDEVSMNVTPLKISNSTYVISGTIPTDKIVYPAMMYWIHVENRDGKQIDSLQYEFAVKPSYLINGRLELYVTSNRADGTIAKPTAFFTNNSTGPIYGTITLVVDGNPIYASPIHIFETGVTKADLKWSTNSIGKLASHNVFAEAKFYNKIIKSSNSSITTFPSKQTVFIPNMVDLKSLTDNKGRVIAVPNTLHSSHLHDDDMHYRVITPNGTCIIGNDNDCLVSKSTYGLAGQVKAVTIGDQIYRVKYSGPESSLERFTISSVDPIQGHWSIELESKKYVIPQVQAMEKIPLKIKYLGKN